MTLPTRKRQRPESSTGRRPKRSDNEPYASVAKAMPNSEMLKVSCARASERPSAALTAGITGRNRWTARGPTSAIEARAKANDRPGERVISYIMCCRPRRGEGDARALPCCRACNVQRSMLIGAKRLAMEAGRTQNGNRYNCVLTSSTWTSIAPRAQGNFAFTVSTMSPEVRISPVPMMRHP